MIIIIIVIITIFFCQTIIIIIIIMIIIITTIIIIILGSYSFYTCSALSEVVLTNGLTVLGWAMFDMNNGGTSLKSVVIPCTVTSIGECF